MNKLLIRKKLENHGRLDSSDMTADEKKNLYAVMKQYGATESFTYNRFFKEGFDLWEMTGITNLINDFLDQNKSEGHVSHKDFWLYLGEVRGKRENFKHYMAERGMKHAVTISQRFTAWNWKEYEIIGIKEVINRL